jgi:hypothetical protein
LNPGGLLGGALTRVKPAATFIHRGLQYGIHIGVGWRLIPAGAAGLYTRDSDEV